MVVVEKVEININPILKRIKSVRTGRRGVAENVREGGVLTHFRSPSFFDCLFFVFFATATQWRRASSGSCSLSFEDALSESFSFFSQRISLLSHSDVRYLGTLDGLDPASATIKLKNGAWRVLSSRMVTLNWRICLSKVFSMGTESRRYVTPPMSQPLLHFSSTTILPFPFLRSRPFYDQTFDCPACSLHLSLTMTDIYTQGPRRIHSFPPKAIPVHYFPSSRGQRSMARQHFLRTPPSQCTRRPRRHNRKLTVSLSVMNMELTTSFMKLMSGI